MITSTDTKNSGDPPKGLQTPGQDLTPDSRDNARSESLILPRIQGLRVLVIGSGKRRRDALARSLNKHQIQAVATTADEHGYRVALKLNPDVAISEIARPGDPGWWLFKRFHRHPVLKWTPALLMNWWTEKNGKEVILTEAVFKRLGEALTPIRMLEERIDAGRKLNDRVETTGIPAVINVIASAGITGALSVNDSWNIFELTFVAGAPRSALRRGVDGREDKGHPAFMQLLLTDSGHWSFKTEKSISAEKNIFLPLPGLFEWARGKLAMLFGPDVTFNQTQLLDNLQVERSLFHDVASTFEGLGRDLLEGIAAGASENELETIIARQEERVDAELAMIALVRCGALQISENTQPLTAAAKKDAQRVAYVLNWIARDHQTEPPHEIQGKSKKRKATTGFYSFSNISSEAISGNLDKYSVKKDTSATVDLGHASNWESQSTLSEGDASWRRQFSDEQEKKPPKILGVIPHDSFAPGPTGEDRGRAQMWLAIAIAIIMAAFLISGLIIIGADDSLAQREDEAFQNE
ncbi:MAG: hypothetical protein JXX14_05460 [Deltaproteobacteria bacterium]|nr:hypothetical protein [Deltaproteobacteria bacterium]